MGITGFLALATQLDHILLGPQRLFRAQGYSADGKSMWIQSDRTTFAWPFRRDRIECNGETRMKTMFSPIGVVPEKPIHVRALNGLHDRNLARFNSFELYPLDQHGRVLVVHNGVTKGLRLQRKGGTASQIGGCDVHDGKIVRNSDGTLAGTLETTDGIARQMLWKKARMGDRIKDFVLHPVCIINPRLLVTLIISGAFDTAWYLIGKDVGRREAEYHAGLAPKPKDVSEKRVIATTLLPIPLAAPTTPKHILQQTAADVGIGKSSASSDSSTAADSSARQNLAQTLPMPGNISQFISGIKANAAPLNSSTGSSSTNLFG